VRFRILFVAFLSLGLAACASSPTSRVENAPPAETPAPQVGCPDCGRVVRIEVTQITTQSRNTGAVLGGVVGGVVGGTTTGGTNAKPTAKPSYRIAVLMDDGRHLVLVQGVISPNLHEGSKVRVDHGRVILLR